MKKNVFILVALLLGLCGCQERATSLSFEKEETIEFQPVDYPELLGVTVQLKLNPFFTSVTLRVLRSV